ncbi:TLC ATP/ADP transporter [Nitzschia inconspicua]|uniref:ADP,ATP carrier protein n=1 Tax=Nitzschia inconspicua TaxID=303405 RepID=A0A9K3LU30_9STRA|nr:TLC ATP/ADP transporter [Nitzschia inconspicua]
MPKPKSPPIIGWTPNQPQRSTTKPSSHNRSTPTSTSPPKRSLPHRSPWSTGSRKDRQPTHAATAHNDDTDHNDNLKHKGLHEQHSNDDEEIYDDDPMNMGLISQRRKSVLHHTSPPASSYEWTRPYWLGGSLFLILFAFWLLDSLKDPIFSRLVDGQMATHQPPAKLVSVFTTLLLVCLLEFWTNRKQQQQQKAILEQYGQAADVSQDHILDPGGIWRRMPMSSMKDQEKEHAALDDSISIAIFFQIGVPYVVAFLVIAILVRKFEQSGPLTPVASNADSLPKFDVWYVLGYVMYATIESFGSLAVATFWSFTNSTLSLQDAERYYGTIIAIAQLGAIGGSTLVASGRWEAPYLLLVVALFIVLQLVLMKLYDRKFQPTSVLAIEATAAFASVSGGGAGSNSIMGGDANSVMTWQDNNATVTKPFWSGLYLIFQHRYIMLILGVSCLYEICMTLFDYQMKLLGLAKFEQDVTEEMSFLEFMGRYGQVVNFTSLIFSSIFFPRLIRHFGLRKTLMLFPTMLLFVAFLVYGALPGNLAVLFFTLSLLKAMTYSIHDPSKEMLYIPTSNAVKFRAKFWIDVVGERILKAVGSAFNTLADTVEQSVQIGRIPSFLSALGLWLACYYVGIYFDKLLATGKVIGLEYSIDPSTYSRIPHTDDGNEGEIPDGMEPSEVEILFEEDNVSTLDLMADPAHDVSRRDYSEERPDRIELPSLIRL